jgi:hypothetical protein
MRVNFCFVAIGFSLSLVISLVFFGFGLGAFTSAFYPSTRFNGERAHDHHMVLTQSIRQVGTSFYNETWRYFMKVIEDCVRIADSSKVNISYSFFDGFFMNPPSE